MLSEIYQDQVKQQVFNKLQNNKQILKREQQLKIDGSNIYQNSINVAIGKPQSGKSVALLTEIMKISTVQHEAHLLIVVNKNGSNKDPTLNIFASLIKIPIIYLSRENLVGFNEIIEYKELYNEIHDKSLENEIIDEQRDKIFEVLHINDFSRNYLHTLLFLEDCGNSEILKKGLMHSLMVECRHIQTSFFITIQSWKMIDPEIKSYLGTVFVFSGFSPERLQYIVRQTNVSSEFKEFMKLYNKLDQNDSIIIDCVTGKISLNYVQ
jgi:hypothetical protein